MSKGTGQAIGYGVTSGLLAGLGVFKKKQEEEKLKSILDNPDATDLQKALAIAEQHPQLAPQFLKNQQKQTNLRQLQENLQNQLNPGGVTNAQNATRNAANQFMEGGGGINPMLAESANLQPGGGQNQPQPMNVPQPVDPIQQLEQQEQAYRNAAAQASQLGEEGIARNYLSQADALQRKNLAQQKLQNQQQQFQQKNLNDIHKQSAPAYEKMQKEYDTSKTRLSSFNVMKQKLQSGNLDPTNFKNLIRKAFENTRWKDFFLNPDQATFQAAALDTYEGMKDIFGTRLSDADLDQASGKVPSIDKTPQANEAIINFHEFKDRMKLEKLKIADEIIDENGGFRPIDFTSQVRKRIEERFGDEAKLLTRLAAYDGEVGPKFDITNPEHKSRRDQILQAVNGDRAKAAQLLSQEFIQ
jgi:hypothetical protein